MIVMGDRKNVVLLFSLFSVGCFSSQEFPRLSQLQSHTLGEDQAQAAADLIARHVPPGRAKDFRVSIDPALGPKGRDTFKLQSTSSNSLSISGTSGVAVAMGFYHYLKEWCHGQVTWAGRQVQLPPSLPVLPQPVQVTTNDRFRYYKNVCTESYSFAFWQWDKWEREIDWMALHGINMPLAFTGQEAIFQRIYLNFGLTESELDQFFAGPAFLAWGRMGNIHGWGGPLPQMWKTNQLLLQHKILARMRSLGMIPVLPAFAGFVPQNITRVFPNANVTRSTPWGRFNGTYTANFLLDFHDSLYQKIGSLFIQEMTREFGTDHIYNADTFNEMVPSSGDPAYLASASRAVYQGIIAGDSEAVWLMQGWLFLNDKFWTSERVKALLTAVPLGHMLILDLASDINPIFSKFESYYGQPFIWCMIHNFGGINQMYGAVDSINNGPIDGRKFANSSMVGIGLTPEGIHQNEVMYEFMMEHSWRTEPRNISDWVSSYAMQRYGASNTDVTTAWKLLMATVYNCSDVMHGNNRARLIQRPDGSQPSKIWYKPADLFSAWEGFVKASSALNTSELFQYDLTDVTRNVLQVIFESYYMELMSAYNNKNSTGIQIIGNQMSSLLADMDKLLSANNRFLLGHWLADAKSWATDNAESKLLEYNARNQITLWGPDGEILDYAAKQWAGVVGDFYKPRWEFYTNWLIQLIKTGSKFDSYIFDKHILNFMEAPWTNSRKVYPTTTAGDAVAIAQALFAKYKNQTKSSIYEDLYRLSQKHWNGTSSNNVFYNKYLI